MKRRPSFEVVNSERARLADANVGRGATDHLQSSILRDLEVKRRTPMLYAVLCYNKEEAVNAWPKEKDDAVMAKHQAAMAKLAERGKLGPVARLMDTTSATTMRAGREITVLDGPFAETKEQLLGFYVLDCESLEEAIEAAKPFLSETGALEIRPVRFFERGGPVR